MKKMFGALAVVSLIASSAFFMSCQQHVHTFADSWTSDETYHWHAATCEHTDEVSDKAEHTFGEWTVSKEATEDAAGQRERTCSVCQYKAVEEISKLDPTLQHLLDKTDETTIDLSNEKFTLEDSQSITLSKSFQITGGTSQYDLKGATITIKAEGVKIDNVKNVEEIIIDESVGDGDFTISNSDVKKMTVNGGGSDSIHIDGVNLADIVVAKENVRLVLEGDSEISAMDLQAACILDSTSESASIASAAIADTVKYITLNGKIDITEISATSKEVKLLIASNDIKLQFTIVRAANGTINIIPMEAASSDIKLPVTKLPDGVKAVYEISYSTEMGVIPEAITAEEGTKLTAAQLPELNADDYIFNGWYIGETKVEADEFTVSKDETLIAKWTRQTGNAAFTFEIKDFADVELKAEKDETTSNIIISADKTYSSYSWTITKGAVKTTAATETITLTPDDYKYGAIILLIAKDEDNHSYSAQYFVKGE